MIPTELGASTEFDEIVIHKFYLARYFHKPSFTKLLLGLQGLFYRFSKAAIVLSAAGKKGGGHKITTPQEMLAQGLIEANNKRTGQEKFTLQARKKTKSLVHDSADAQDSLLSSTPATSKISCF